MFYYVKFKEFRLKKGINVSETARKSGISRVSIWSWENGKSEPSPKNIKILAEVINKNVSDISDLEEDVPNSEVPLANILKPYTFFNDTKTVERLAGKRNLLETIANLYDDLAQATTIINSILSNIPSMFYIKDLKQKYVTANKSFIENYSNEHFNYVSIVGKTDKDFMPRNDAVKNTEKDEEVIKTGKPIKNSISYLPGSRKKKWAMISKYPIMDTQSRVTGLIGTFVDITDEKRAEELHELMEINIRSMSEGFTIYDFNNKKYLFMNNALESIFGYKLKHFYEGGRTFWINTCVHPDDRERIKTYKMTQNWPKINEYRIIKPNGDVRWIRTRAFPDVTYKGKTCHVNLDSDITELRGVSFLKLIEFSLNGISDSFELQEESTNETVFANNAVEEIFGYPKEKIADFDFWLNNCVHPEDRKKQKRFKIENNIPPKRKYRIIKPDGEVRWLETSRWIKEFQGKKYLAVINRDITKEIRN
jgi:PAS domain S-box-containing protein